MFLVVWGKLDWVRERSDIRLLEEWVGIVVFDVSEVVNFYLVLFYSDMLYYVSCF